ncbi:MAG: hypothetical protein COW01_03630 [Bdellovibrionales bacterium CG12_big_fil_rev_8_21_14_0_65_38_15]|nr:MAG: hypothetical protein COW01_03630 [Bdellovibrionales bacterium CG12_big_fil_rev_8_21_14_0_65_38_15]
MKNLKVLRVFTVPIAMIGYKKHLEEQSRTGIDLHIGTSMDDKFDLLKNDNFYKTYRLNIAREISPLSDIRSCFNTYLLINKIKPNIVHSNTPKAGIVSSISSFLSGVPVRIHTFTGQRWITLKGLKRTILKFIDKIIISINTHVIADSPSQAAFLNKEFRTNKVVCLGAGSFGGICFDDKKEIKIPHIALNTRQKLGINETDFVMLFLGRVVKDKGVEELIDAFVSLKTKYKGIKLLVVGPVEELGNKISDHHLKILRHDPDIISTGYTSEPHLYYPICNIFILPSYREGFGTVILEAASFRKASIGTRIYGIQDAILDEVTGLLCEAGSSTDLSKKIERCLIDKNLVEQMGNKAFERALENFDYKVVTKNLLDFYRNCLNEKSL